MNRILIVLCILLGLGTANGEDSARRIDFVQDVQPILNRHCDRCHGSRNQEAGLQLNFKEAMFGNAASDQPIVVRHHADASLLIRRISSAELGDRMPVDGSPLAAGEIAVLRTWIDQGAPWPDTQADSIHWAYQPIRRPKVAGEDAGNPVDYFVHQQRQSRGLTGRPRLDRPRLIRRLSLALTGLPPTIDQVDRFTHDPSENAYQALIDRLLESPTFGERWAVSWLDLARYADSNGFQADQIRENWAYRDWVIRAFNNDLPFDQFVIDQIAGDLHQNPSEDQRIATGFHRMTTCNVEAGVHPEANRFNQVVDRVNTTATVFLGTTLECAQCHDHKYDPFAHTDYYKLLAYFNNTPLEVKNTTDVTWDFDGPSMTLQESESTRLARETAQQDLENLQARRRGLVDDAEESFQASLAQEISTGKPNRNVDREREKFLSKYPPVVELDRQIARAKAVVQRLAPITTLVMVELPQPRETFVMVRGNYDHPGQAVQPGLPKALPFSESADGGDRMQLARWLTSPENPLLARVTVNRWWGELFGRGIVSTPEDFGSQGESPTHPQLLDWLACELIESGWSMKHVIKTIVMSDAFQQSSTVTSQAMELDPDNRWITRGPRFRLPAELIRDNALAVSGLLSLEMYGRPIMPYQPDGIWRSVGRNQPSWKTAEDHSRYRRGIYVVWKRAAPYPSFINFDAPNRGNCTVRRDRSNTPLQALTLLNDPAYTEMASAFARRVIREAPESTDASRIEFAVRLALARSATEQEQHLLGQLLIQERDALRDDRTAVSKRTAMAKQEPGEAFELAVWFSVCNTLLNLDEVICQ